MAYAQGGLIQASDYNTFVGSSPSSTVNTVNTVWAVGSGSAGYGQSAIPQVAVSNTVTAAQWASLINTLNSMRTHQSGSGTGISAVTAGQTIDYIATLSANITTAYSNRLSFASNSAVVVGPAQAVTWSSGTTSSTLTRAFGMRATFASADQARYFFNSGGRLKYNISAAQSGSTTARTNAVINLVNYDKGIGLFAANTNAGRLGTGGTLVTNATTRGYWTSPYNANTTVVSVNSLTTNYTTDSIITYVKPSGTQGTNNDNGSNVEFWTVISSTSGGNSGGSFDDSLGVSVSQSVDVSYPETTNLANTWGAVTLTRI